MSGGGAEREGDTESEAGFRFWAVSTEPDAGLEPTNHEMVTWAKVGRLTHWATQAPLFFFIFFNVFIYFLDRERQSMSRGGAEREGDTDSEAGSRLWAVSTEPDVGPELRNSGTVRSWPELKSDTQPTEPSRNPWAWVFLILFLTKRLDIVHLEVWILLGLIWVWIMSDRKSVV